MVEKTTALQKALAFEFAKEYCKKRNYSVEKLIKQRFFRIGNEAIFAQPSDVTPNGLVNDLETQPKATLIIKLQDGTLLVNETEFTAQYLS